MASSAIRTAARRRPSNSNARLGPYVARLTEYHAPAPGEDSRIAGLVLTFTNGPRVVVGRSNKVLCKCWPIRKDGDSADERKRTSGGPAETPSQRLPNGGEPCELRVYRSKARSDGQRKLRSDANASWKKRAALPIEPRGHALQ